MISLNAYVSIFVYIRKERRTFERYQKAAHALPDKKEREEIEALKSQVGRFSCLINYNNNNNNTVRILIIL